MKVEVNRNDESRRPSNRRAWYRIYKPSITLEWPGILELAETEDELLDYLEDVSEFTRNEKGNN